MSELIVKGAKDLSTFLLGASRNDDSAGDRLSYRLTCIILVAFILIVSSKELNEKRIQCWVCLKILVMICIYLFF